MPKHLACRRATPAALIALTISVLLGAHPSPARAGTYDVLACNSAPAGQTSSWRIASQPAGYAAGLSCPTSSSQKGMYGYVAPGAITVPAWSMASISFTAPAGASVKSLVVDADGGTSQDAYWSGLYANGQMLWGCAPVDGNAQCSYRNGTATFNAVNAPAVDFSAGCLATSCSTAWDPAGLAGVGSPAWFFIRSARVTVADSTAPTVSMAGGPVGWVGGGQSIGVNASDNVGVKGTSYAIDGIDRDSRLQSCDYTRTVPCPAAATDTYSFDTRALTDGSHTLAVGATDAANNGITGTATRFSVDNTAPAAPSDLSVDQGESWRSANNFSVHWTNPPDDGSAVAKAYYRVCRADDPTDCQPVRSQAASGISSLSGITVPSEGDWLLAVYLEDQVGNVAAANASAPVHLRYDATAPGQPQNVQVVGGSGWRSNNSFEIKWDSPAGQLAPLSVAYYRLCDGNGNCSVRSQSATDISSLVGIAVAAPGEYTLSVWLGDEAGNADRANASGTVDLRFDDTNPGASGPPTPDGWLGDAAVAGGYEERVALAPGATLPPSGIAGFSVTTDGSDPDDSPDTSVDGAFHIDHLPEGRVTVKSRAVSGSGVASSHVGSGVLLVDRSAPAVTVVGAPDPGQWQPGVVELDLRGEDQAGLSGMDGGQLSYSVDGGDAHQVVGASAHVTVSGDGEHTVSYRATDAAGNESPEAIVSFKIDGDAPGLAEPEGTGGWKSVPAGSFVEHMRLASGTHVPASGVVGYSVTTDGSDPDDTPETDSSGTFLIPDLPDGVTVVKARAISGAGVASPEIGSAELRIDRTAPERVVLLPPASDPPSEISAEVADATSGVHHGAIELRPAGSGSWRSLPAVLDGDRLIANLDSSQVGRALYEFRAVATDVAGNTRIGDELKGGGHLTLWLGTEGPSSTSAPAAAQGPAALPPKPAAHVCNAPKRVRHRHARRRHRNVRHGHRRRRPTAACGRKRGGEKHRHRHLADMTHKRAR